MTPLVPARPPAPPEAWRPRPYTQLLRGPRHRWWRPLVSLSVVVGGLVVLFVLLVVVVGLGLGLTAASDGGLAGLDVEDEVLTSWWGFLANNLLLAALIPLSALAVFAGHRWRPRWTSSVVGGLRWRWMVLSGLVPLLALVVLLGGSWLLDPEAFGSGAVSGDAVALLVVVVLTTPLQAAGEEYLFRGWLSQAVGSWFARAGLGALVAAGVSATLFAMAHGSQDPWLFVDRLAFGLVASYLVWRTGGLETAIAFHALNNVLIFIPTVLSGGLEEALTSTSAPASAVVVDLVVFVVIAAVVTWLARRQRLQRLFVPPAHALVLPGVHGPSGARVEFRPGAAAGVPPRT